MQLFVRTEILLNLEKKNVNSFSEVKNLYLPNNFEDTNADCLCFSSEVNIFIFSFICFLKSCFAVFRLIFFWSLIPLTSKIKTVLQVYTAVFCWVHLSGAGWCVGVSPNKF